ncbi:hypothetical protein M422DRAFT_40858 [Sphaerobolus stellatus SS14]|nr:hypothetical protein M422DRAFT_40858 [Sphaerobolus stellatus SS14]
MKGIILTEFKKPYTFSSDIPVPKIKRDNEILIKVVVAGYCRSEILVQQGEFAAMMKHQDLPLIPSHECAGTVVEIGAKVDNLKVGDRVAATFPKNSCSRCEDCRSNMPKYCNEDFLYGVTADGAAAEYMVADSQWTVVLPETMSFAVGACLMCAGATIYGGLKTANLSHGETVAIVGHIGVQFAKLMGLRVVCVDNHEAPLRLVKGFKYSPDYILDSKNGVQWALEQIEGVVDAAIRTTDDLPAFDYGLSLTLCEYFHCPYIVIL